MKQQHQTNNPSQSKAAKGAGNPLESEAMPNAVNFSELGQKICKDLGLGAKDIGEMTRIVQQVLLGKADRPERIASEDWSEMLSAFRYEIIRSFGQNPALTSLCEKAALSFAAFDRGLDEQHQNESLRSLHRSSPAIAESLALLKAREAKDENLSGRLSLLGEFEPALQIVMSAHALRADRAKWEDILRASLGEKIFSAIERSDALNVSRQLDAGRLLREALPALGDEASTARMNELGKKLLVLRAVPQIEELDLAKVAQLGQAVVQIAVKDTELSACVAASLFAQHGKTLKEMGVLGIVKTLDKLDGDLGRMFREYFAE